jgi:spore germination protein YaaH
LKYVLFTISILAGITFGLIIPNYKTIQTYTNKKFHLIKPIPTSAQNEVLGFLMYSLLSRAKQDYSKEITKLAYFSVTLDSDGTILRLDNDGNLEPGWNNLVSGQAEPFLENAKQHNIGLTLVAFNGDSAIIDTIISDPGKNAQNMVNDITPVMNRFGFTELNLDIESTKTASPAARQQFMQFLQTARRGLKDHNKNLTLDITTMDLIYDNTLIPVKEAAKQADQVVIMGYDYHSTASSVTGAVAPLSGAGISSEYDIRTAVQKALAIIPANKIVLGSPLYGYSWETLSQNPRNAIIPGSGNTASNRRSEALIASCATCSAVFDSTTQEAYTIYRDSDTDTYHQFFYPTAKSMEEKIQFAQKYKLHGLALWALGYEGNTILNPLNGYINKID